MRIKELFRLGAVLGVWSLLTAVSWGYVFIKTSTGKIVQWNPGSITMLVRVPASAPLQDGSNYTTCVVAAMDEWNAVLGRVQFTPTVQQAGTGTDQNDVNEMFFSNTIYGSSFGSSTLAVTTTIIRYVRDDGTVVRGESDVIINQGRLWDSYRGPLQGSYIDLRRVVVHELGHALCLDHPDQAGQSVTAIMRSTVSSIDTLQTDDISGAQFIYGATRSNPPPANDNFANAIAVTAPGTYSGSNVGAFKESGEPFHVANEMGGASVWWKYTATSNGTLNVNTRGSTFDSMMAIYTGSSVSALTQLASNDDEQAPGTVPEEGRIRTSILSIPVTSGTTYYIAVDGWAAEAGAVTLNVELVAPPSITTQPAAQTVNVGQSVTFSVAASGGGLSYQWQKNQTDISGATQASYTIPSATTTDVGSYRVVVTNSSGSVTSNGVTLTVNQLAQTITFALPATVELSSSPLTLTATASSGLPVSFSVVSGPGQLTGNQLTLTAVGTVRIRAEQAGDTTYTAATSVLRDIAVTATGFSSWRVQQFSGLAAANDAVSGASADPDGDGLVNLVEFALGTAPMAFDSGSVLVPTLASGEWTFTYTRPVGRTGVTYAVEVSSDLTAWSASGVQQTLVSSVNGVETWIARTPAGDAPLFARLKITAP